MKTGRFAASALACSLVVSFCVENAYALSASKKIEGVPAINQYPQLPTGCEPTAVAMLLQWANVSTTKEEVARKIPKEPLPWSQYGKLWGGNPYQGFVGDPFSSTGFGVFSQPILGVINQFLPGRALSLTGSSFDELLETVDTGRPVVVWATIGLKPASINSTWLTSDGGQVIWKIPEHAMTLIGFDESNVIVNDPSNGQTRTYSRSLFKQRYEQMGSHAVTLTASASPAVKTPAAKPTVVNPSGFSDVPPSHPQAIHITELHKKGIVNGYETGLFRPDASLSRAEFVKLLVTAFAVPKTNTALPFNDVPAWAADYVRAANANGFVKGLASDTFGPDEPITREQAAVIVWRLLKQQGVPSVAAADGQSQNVTGASTGQMHDYAEEAVRNILAYKLHGPEVQHDDYQPLRNMTRGESAALFNLSIQKLQK